MDGGSTSVHIVRVDDFASLASPAGGETRASFLGREIPPVGRRVEPRRGRLTRGVPVESAVARHEDSFHPVKVNLSPYFFLFIELEQIHLLQRNKHDLIIEQIER
jgi:hypothetical protein